MIFLLLVASCVGVGLILGLKLHHYLLVLVLSMLGAYELLAPVLFLLADDSNSIGALEIFGFYASKSAIASFSQVLLVFFLLFIVAYSVASGLGPKIIARSDIPSRSGPSLVIFLPVLLVFGIVSSLTGAGQSRLEDYVGQVNETTRVFSYGCLLFVVCTGLFLYQVSSRNWRLLLITIVCLTPLTIEMFIAGKRQWFAPSALLVLLVLLYSRIRYKTLWTSALVLAMAAFFAVQFSLREALQDVDVAINAESLPYAIAAPQVGEFVAIGSTSFYAWNMFVLEDQSPTFGLHWGFHLLNTLPYLKIGDLFFPSYSNEVFGIYNAIAPWGGLSMLSDAIMGLGWIGVPLLGITLGVLCRIAHEYVVMAMRFGVPVDVKSIYVLSLISTLIPKYRSGIGDLLQNVVAFTLLYWAIVLLGHALFSQRISAMRPPIA